MTGTNDSKRDANHREKDWAGWHVVGRFLPYLWPKDRPDLRWRIAGATLFVILAKAVVLALPFAYAGAVDAMSKRGDEALWVAHGAGHRLRGRPLLDRAVRQRAQRDLRARRAGRSAPADRGCVRPVAQPEPAVPLVAADRRGHQDRRTRLEVDQHDDLLPAVQHRPDRGRDAGRGGDLLRQVRLGDRARDRGDGGILYLGHPHDHRMAHQAARADERPRRAGARARGRLAAQLRDGEVLRRREARAAALRLGGARLCRGGDQERELARPAQHRAGGDHEPR